MSTTKHIPLVSGSPASALGELPLVSVGIPTYNRPDGLRRTLSCITRQTYRHLEIIVSDNCSTDFKVAEVCREFSAADERVTVHRQTKNVGATENFRFVLRRATGPFFMWAADDDEWDDQFIETCMASHDPDTSVMTGIATIFRRNGAIQENPVCNLSPEKTVYQNATEFIRMMQSSLFYGVHPKKNILFILEDEMFDFYDCYFVLRLILDSHFRTVQGAHYRAGVDADSYQIKYATPERVRGLHYRHFLARSARAIGGCGRLSVLDKVALTGTLALKVLELKRHHGRS